MDFIRRDSLIIHDYLYLGSPIKRNGPQTIDLGKTARSLSFDPEDRQTSAAIPRLQNLYGFTRPNHHIVEWNAVPNQPSP